jgi:RimJ/RimL family protein N-acetyltransferase
MYSETHFMHFTLAGGIVMILETERLQLREMTFDDLDDLYAILSDPIAMQHYPKPYDRKGVEDWIERNLQRYAEEGFGLWAVVHKEDARFIGDCGLTIQQVDGIGELEIGYHILRAYWGQGLATEAARACRDYAFDVLGRDRVISWMHPENVASRRVAEKNGMRLKKETHDRHGRPAVVYSMTPADREQADK